MSRYDGRPLLRLLELYVLFWIGELPREQVAALKAMEPHLRETFQKRGSWYEILEAELDLHAAAREEIRQLWQADQQKASAAGRILRPQQFAELIVDSNFDVGPHEPPN